MPMEEPGNVLKSVSCEKALSKWRQWNGKYGYCFPMNSCLFLACPNSMHESIYLLIWSRNRRYTEDIINLRSFLIYALLNAWFINSSENTIMKTDLAIETAELLPRNLWRMGFCTLYFVMVERTLALFLPTEVERAGCGGKPSWCGGKPGWCRGKPS